MFVIISFNVTIIISRNLQKLLIKRKKILFSFSGATLARWRMKFNSPFPLTNAVFTYTFDRMQRLVLIVPKIGNMPLQPLEFSTNMTTGRKEQIGPFRCYERFHNESVVSDGVASIIRQVDPLYRLKFLSIVISDKEVS